VEIYADYPTLDRESLQRLFQRLSHIEYLRFATVSNDGEASPKASHKIYGQLEKSTKSGADGFNSARDDGAALTPDVTSTGRTPAVDP
jgi:hypothetical protein